MSASNSEVKTENFIGEDELLVALGYERRADLIKELDRQGIFYFTGRGGRVAVPKMPLPKRDDEPRVQYIGPTKFRFE